MSCVVAKFNSRDGTDAIDVTASTLPIASAAFLAAARAAASAASAALNFSTRSAGRPEGNGAGFTQYFSN